MKCELCGGTFTTTDVDAIYQHASDVHDIEVNDLRTASRSPINVGVGHFRYQLADGPHLAGCAATLINRSD